MKLPGPLASLDEDQHRFMIDMLSLGKTDGEITDALQQDQGWLADVKRPSLLRAVNRWRKSTGQQAVIKLVTDNLTRRDGRPKRQLDVHEELTDLVLRQKARVDKIAQQEDGKPLLLNVVTEEMKVLSDMLGKLARVQMDIGIVRRVRVGETADNYEPQEAEFEEIEDIFTEEDRQIIEAISGDG